MKPFLFIVLGFVALSTQANADCGGVCVPGPGTPSYAYKACQMVNTFPSSIKEKTCEGTNGCVWREATAVPVCVPGPGTPSYAAKACQMVNSFPIDIRYQSCVNANGCIVQSVCQ